MIERQQIIRMQFGSHLYGTNTPSSDTDYKEVAFPSAREIRLGKIWTSENVKTKANKDAKNTSQDVDIELFSLHAFMKLACEGQTVALDMLHAPRQFWIGEPHPVWYDLMQIRNWFYTKNLQSFVGYARRQAAKYGIKGSRLDAVSNTLAAFRDSYNHFGRDSIIANAIGGIEDAEHVKVNIDVEGSPIKHMQVCGKMFPYTAPLYLSIQCLEKFEAEYGNRARLAAANEGIDWKAVSHAIRAACQVKEILTHGTLTFPRPEADYLKRVKRGELDYLNQVAPYLEELMGECELLSENSPLPEKVDREKVNDWLARVIEAYVI